MMRMIIQEEPPQPLLHPQPMSRTPFRFSNSYYEKQKEVLQRFKNNPHKHYAGWETHPLR